jgi:hypothetical protein
LDDAEFFEFETTARAGLAGSRLQREHLTDVGQQERSVIL